MLCGKTCPGKTQPTATTGQSTDNHQRPVRWISEFYLVYLQVYGRGLIYRSCIARIDPNMGDSSQSWKSGAHCTAERLESVLSR